MVSFDYFKEDMKSRGVIDITPLDYSFSMMVAFGVPPIDAYISTFKNKEYLAKTEQNRPDYLSKCEKEADRLLNDKRYAKMIEVLKIEFNNQVKEHAFDLGDRVELSSTDIKKITAKLLSSKASDITNVETKDLISAIKLYMDNFIDSTNDNERMFSRHFIEIHSPCNMVCAYCNHEFRILEGISQKCPTCNHLYKWDTERERFVD